ncbi:MAG: hypothetical protein ABIH00_09265 [Armatimonadota bacterium]
MSYEQKPVNVKDVMYDLFSEKEVRYDKYRALAEHLSDPEKINFTEKILAKTYVNSLIRTFNILAGCKHRLFRSVEKNSTKITDACNDLLGKEKYADALGLMYSALKYNTGLDKNYKVMVDNIIKKDSPEKKEASEIKEKEVSKNETEKSISEESKKTDSSFNLKKFNSEPASLKTIDSKEFEIIEGTYKKYKRFMKSIWGVYFEKKDIITGKKKTTDVKIKIDAHPVKGKDENGDYIEYRATRTDTEKGRKGIIKTTTTKKVFRKYTTGEVASKETHRKTIGRNFVSETFEEKLK